MPLMDLQATCQRLMAQYGYNEKGAQRVAHKLATLTPELQTAAERWWSDSTPITFEAGGKTVVDLKRQFGMNDIAAILTLNAIVIDPVNILAGLEKGLDDIR